MKSSTRVRQRGVSTIPTSPPRPRICLVTPYPPWLSGIGEYSRELAEALAPDAEIVVLTHRFTGAPDREDRAGVRILRVWDPRSPLAPFRLFSAIRRLRPAVVHVQYGLYGQEFGGIVGEPILLLALLLRVAGTPTMATLHSVWSRADVRKRVVERSGRRGGGSLTAAAVGMMMRWSARLFRPLLVSATSKDDSLLRPFAGEYGIPQGSLSPTLFGLVPRRPLDRIEARARLGLPPTAPVFLVFGFIYEDKGIDTAIRALGRAAARLQGAILLVSGPVLPGRGPPYLEALREMASRLPPEVSVRFHPEFLNEDEASWQFAAADAVLLPYRRSVGTSAVLHRAMAEGRATVSTIAGWYAVPRAGVIEVRPDDESGFADAMVSLATDAGLRERLENEARLAADERRWSLVAEDTLNTYRKVSALKGADAVGPSS